MNVVVDCRPLSTAQLLRAVNDRLAHGYNRHFKGVLPVDVLDQVMPHLLEPPLSCAIVNVDPSTDRGSHWIVLYNSGRGVVDVYDPLGIYPYQKDAMMAWTTWISRTSRVNARRMQLPYTNACGYLCVHYITRRLFRGWTHDQYLAAYAGSPFSLTLEAVYA